MAYLKVDGSTSYVRDTKSGAIININTSEFNQMKKIRENRKNKENELDVLKNEVSEIKSLLKQLLEKS
jgi:hypothetical protein|tara:strand:+ start:192 stop:395 length:204 start_codon:yes stop_codon:yes gene_type:complete